MVQVPHLPHHLWSPQVFAPWKTFRAPDLHLRDTVHGFASAPAMKWINPQCSQVMYPKWTMKGPSIDWHHCHMEKSFPRFRNAGVASTWLRGCLWPPPWAPGGSPGLGVTIFEESGKPQARGWYICTWHFRYLPVQQAPLFCLVAVLPWLQLQGPRCFAKKHAESTSTKSIRW